MRAALRTDSARAVASAFRRTTTYFRFRTASSINAVSSRYVSRISSSAPTGPGRPGTSRSPAAAGGAKSTWQSSAPDSDGADRVGADRRRRDDPVPAAQPLQAHDLLARQQPLPAEHPRDEADVREVLDGLHLVVGREEIRAERQRAVVREQHAVVRLDVLARPRRAAPWSTASRTPRSARSPASSRPPRGPRDRAECRRPRTPSPPAGARGRPPGSRGAGGTPRGASVSRTTGSVRRRASSPRDP